VERRPPGKRTDAHRATQGSPAFKRTAEVTLARPCHGLAIGSSRRSHGRPDRGPSFKDDNHGTSQVIRPASAPTDRRCWVPGSSSIGRALERRNAMLACRSCSVTDICSGDTTDKPWDHATCVKAVRRWTLPPVTLVALLVSLAGAPPAHANGDSSLSLHRFSFTTVVENAQLDFGYRWGVTVCTPGRGRVRIRAIVDSIDFGTESHRFVRRQPGGCKRHRLRAFAEIPEGSTDSILRVAWRNQHRRTQWLTASDPAPD
jgi:hypothetical protein